MTKHVCRYERICNYPDTRNGKRICNYPDTKWVCREAKDDHDEEDQLAGRATIHPARDADGHLLSHQ